MTTAPISQQEKLQRARDEETRKHRNRALMLMGAGGASAGIGAALLSKQDEGRIAQMAGGGKTLERLMGDNPTFNQQQQFLHAYGEAGHDALSAKVFGIPGRQFIERLRTTPLVDKPYRWRGDPSKWHYDSFQQGPLYGYMQILNEKTQDAGLFGGNTEKAFRTRDKFNRSLVDRINNISRDATGRAAVTGLDGPTGGQNMNRILSNPGVNPLSLDEQRKVLREISNTRNVTGWLSPKFSQRYREAVTATQGTAHSGFKQYGTTIGGSLIKARHALTGAGLLLGGAGLGVGGYYLARKWQDRKRRQKEEERKKILASAGYAV